MHSSTIGSYWIVSCPSNAAASAQQSWCLINFANMWVWVHACVCAKNKSWHAGTQKHAEVGEKAEWLQGKHQLWWLDMWEMIFQRANMQEASVVPSGIICLLFKTCQLRLREDLLYISAIYAKRSIENRKFASNRKEIKK